jgi:hypothetical protein
MREDDLVDAVSEKLTAAANAAGMLPNARAPRRRDGKPCRCSLCREILYRPPTLQRLRPSSQRIPPAAGQMALFS